jgi:hypothetical protein
LKTRTVVLAVCGVAPLLETQWGQSNGAANYYTPNGYVVKYRNKQAVKNLLMNGKTLKLYAVWQAR